VTNAGFGVVIRTRHVTYPARQGLGNGQTFRITGSIRPMRWLILGAELMGTSFPEVLRRTRDGDPSAFAVLWREYQPPLLRYLRVTAHEAAEDVASETWASVTASITKFDGDESAFRAWLFTVARRRAIDHFRSEARRPAVPMDPVVLGSASPSSTDPDPADATVSTLALESALLLIADLPAAQRDAVMLRAIAGLDVPHVAAIMGKRPGTVRVLAHRGLRTLARRLSEEEERAVTP
jgi:RNA polymerase sigma-70 factor, ECF subfamily